MEKIISDLSSINIQPEESTQVRDFTFPRKKILSNEESNMIASMSSRILTNYAKLEFQLKNQDKVGLFVFSMSLRESDGKGITDPHRFVYLINSIKNCSFLKHELNKAFSEYIISGNSIFAFVERSNINPLSYKIIFRQSDKGNEISLISQEEYTTLSEVKENSRFLYELDIYQKFEIKNNLILKKEEKEILKRFLNIAIGYKMQKRDYIKSIVSKKVIYYKNFEKFKNARIQIDNDKFYSRGYQLISNFYEKEDLMLKIIPKFRIMRNSTFNDYRNYLFESFPDQKAKKIFEEDSIGARGVKIYDQQQIKIDGIEYQDPKDIYFDCKLGSEIKNINLIEYYLIRWDLKLKKGVQPIFYHLQKFRNYQSEKQEEKRAYFFPYYLLMVGLLPGEEVDASLLKFSPREKFENICQAISEVEKACDNSNNLSAENKILNIKLEYNPLFLNSIVIDPPELIFKKEKVKPDLNGTFRNQQEPYKNDELARWLIFCYDCSLEEAKEVFEKLKEASINLKMILSDKPKVMGIKTDTEENLKQNFDLLISEIAEKENLKKIEEKYQICVLITSEKVKKKSNAYKIFKDSLNYYNLGIPSQVIIKDYALKKKFSYHSNLLTQMWAKRNLLVWRIKYDDIFKDSIIVSYSVTYNKTLRKNLTTIGVTYDKLFSSMLFYSAYDDSQERSFISNKISILLKVALNRCIRLYDKTQIKNIIFLRDGGNESQRRIIMESEFAVILSTINEIHTKKEIETPKVIYVFVNKICETKLFQSYQNHSFQKNQGGSFNLELGGNIENPCAGTLVENVIVSPNEWEFYINSTCPQQGTSNPTHYIVGYDSTAFPAGLFYQLLYHLTYGYFNTAKCVRIPGLLHRVIRRSQFIINHLSGEMGDKFNVWDVSL
jgi:hypothetical protein